MFGDMVAGVRRLACPSPHQGGLKAMMGQA